MYSKELHHVIRSGYYAMRVYLTKTRDFQAANDEQLLVYATEMFDDLKADGGEEALGCFDNICSYLVAVGETCAHGQD